MSKTAFLAEKTDAQCRQLAAQYYIRARRAEKDLEHAKDEIRRLEMHASKLRSLAQDMLEVQ